MGFIKNIISKLIRRVSAKNMQAYINMDEIRKAQQKKEQTLYQTGEFIKRKSFF